SEGCALHPCSASKSSSTCGAGAAARRRAASASMGTYRSEMGFPLVAFIGALLAGPLPPPKTTCIPESGDGALAVTRMTMTGAPPMPRLAPLATWTGKELLLWARDQRLSGGEAVAKWKGWVYAYAPATDRWRRLSVSRSLPPRTD